MREKENDIYTKKNAKQTIVSAATSAYKPKTKDPVQGPMSCSAGMTRHKICPYFSSSLQQFKECKCRLNNEAKNVSSPFDYTVLKLKQKASSLEF